MHTKSVALSCDELVGIHLTLDVSGRVQNQPGNIHSLEAVQHLPPSLPANPTPPQKHNIFMCVTVSLAITSWFLPHWMIWRLLRRLPGYGQPVHQTPQCLEAIWIASGGYRIQITSQVSHNLTLIWSSLSSQWPLRWGISLPKSTTSNAQQHYIICSYLHKPGQGLQGRGFRVFHYGQSNAYSLPCPGCTRVFLDLCLQTNNSLTIAFPVKLE